MAPTARKPRNIIRKPEVRNRTGLSDSQTWRLEQAGNFPARVKLGPMAVGWFEDEVDDWVNSRSRAGGRQPPLPKKRRVLSS
jgi:prophage regulatory protein